jgi:hypothetical protein
VGVAVVGDQAARGGRRRRRRGTVTTTTTTGGGGFRHTHVLEHLGRFATGSGAHVQDPIIAVHVQQDRGDHRDGFLGDQQ